MPNLLDGVSSSDPDSPLTVLCVGRLGRHKAQMWLLDVYREARRNFNRPARLVLVGRDEGDAAAIAAYIEQHGLQEEVVITGEVSDIELARWYARADLFTLFSHYEAFGLVFFEAMAYGAPVLSHDVGSNRELLHRGALVTPRFDRKAAAGQPRGTSERRRRPETAGRRGAGVRPRRVHLACGGGEVSAGIPGRAIALAVLFPTGEQPRIAIPGAICLN